MNKKLTKSGILALLVFPVIAFSQTTAGLPSAGIAPDSRFYFLDRFGETLQRILTFSREGKARLEVKFAAERISEIKVVLEGKGVSAPGLEVANERLNRHLADAASIVNEEKAAGRNVVSLAGDLDDRLNDQKKALEQVFKDRKVFLENKEEELNKRLDEARRAGDVAQTSAILAEISAIKANKEKLEKEKEERKKAFEENKKKIEKESDYKERAEKEIAEAERRKAEITAKAAAAGIKISPEEIAKFDRLLAQAKELFSKGNYQGAKQLADQAKDSLERAISQMRSPGSNVSGSNVSGGNAKISDDDLDIDEDEWDVGDLEKSLNEIEKLDLNL